MDKIDAKTPKHYQNKPQKGFVLILVIVVVVIIATLWLSMKQERLISLFKSDQIDYDLEDLKQVKQRLLQFAVLQPEVYITNTSGNVQGSAKVPAPGYLPCPDVDDGAGGPADGIADGSCTNPLLWASPDTSGFLPDSLTFGYVPELISSRHFYFAEKTRYFYFLDERFSYANPGYVNDNLKRFAPLNPIRLEGDPAAQTSNFEPRSFDPVLTLNGVTGYVALLVDAGQDGLDAANKDGDRHFITHLDDLREDPNADKIIGISYIEWLAMVAHRVCAERNRLQGIGYDLDETDPVDAIADLDDIGAPLRHWYNDYDSTTNPVGGNWRTWGSVCP